MPKPDHELEIPVGVSLTHDKGYPIFFAYVGSSRGRLGMRAKRFNPRKLGSMERALRQAIRWRKQALREYTAELAALAAVPVRKKGTKSTPATRHKERRSRAVGASKAVRS